MSSRITFGKKRAGSESRQRAPVCTCSLPDSFDDVTKTNPIHHSGQNHHWQLYPHRTLNGITNSDQDPNINDSEEFSKCVIKDNSHTNINLDSDLEEPEGGLFPILLPNEVLLQKLTKSCAYKVSGWKMSEAKARCQLCSIAIIGIDTNQVHIENDHRELTQSSRAGTLYITSERIIFVPDCSDQKGWSIMVTKFDKTKVVISTEQEAFFVAYIGNFICSIPFSTVKRARSFLKMMANINLEHMVRQHLPPRYGCDLEEEYDKLPSYQDSESALKKYLSFKGADSIKELLRKQRESDETTVTTAVNTTNSLSLSSRTQSTQSYDVDYYYAASFVWF